MYIEELTRFGLSDKEARVYLALLELEVATVNEIAKTAGINRSSTYVVLDSLQKHGLVSISAGKKIKKYVVEPPERLVQIAERAVRTHTDIKHDLNNILPDLKFLYKGMKQKPSVRIYEGQQAILNMISEDAKSVEKVVRVFQSFENVKGFFLDFMPKYSQDSKNSGIKYFSITSDTETNRKIESMMLPHGKIVLVPKNKYKFTSDFTIFDNSTFFLSHSDTYAVRVDSKEIADVMKTVFDLAFEGAKNKYKMFSNSTLSVTRR